MTLDASYKRGHVDGPDAPRSAGLSQLLDREFVFNPAGLGERLVGRETAW